MNELNQTAAKRANKIKTADLVMTGMFTAIICVMAQLVIPTQPIPFTLVLFAIFLTGALLSPRNAFLAVFIYLLIGVCGVPVFAGFKGGPQALFGNTGGYLMAFPVMSLVTSLFYKYSRKYKLIALIVGMILSLLLCYLIGTLWFCLISGTGFLTALFLCVIPYVLFDCLKIVLAISVSMVIRKTAMRNLRV